MELLMRQYKSTRSPGFIRSLLPDSYRSTERAVEFATLPIHTTELFAQIDAATEESKISPGGDQIQYLNLRHDLTVVRHRITEIECGLKSNYRADGWLCLRLRFSGDLRERFGLDERIYRGANASFVNYGNSEEYEFRQISTAPVSSLSLLFRRSFLIDKLGGESVPVLRLLDAAAQAQTPELRRHWLTIPFAEPMKTMACDLLDADENKPMFRLWAEAKSMEVLAMALQALTDSYEEAGENLLKPSELRQIQQACDILNRSLAAPPTTDVLCRQVGMSRRRLYRGFKLATGQTINEYLQALRMQYAVELLSQSLPVRLVAETVGYLDQSSFTKVFKRHFGIVPSRFQKS